MPIDQIKQGIIGRRDSELESLRTKFRSEMLSVNSRMEKQKSDLDSTYKKKTEEDTKAHVKRTVDGATLEARQIINARRGELLDNSLARMLDQLGEIRKSPEYPKILNLMVKTIGRMIGDNCTIYARREDATKIKAAENVKIKESSLDGIGGLLARSSDEKVELDLTLTTVFKDLRETLMQEIYSRIR